MAEFWKSTPKYWCKHCSIYVKDTKFERDQHEATGKHQGNLKRFLRGVHQDREKEEREKQRAKAEVERLRGLVGGQTSTAPKSEAQTPGPSKPRQPASASQATVAERKRQLAQLAEMGIAVPDEYRGDLAMAGEWQIVSQRPLGNAAQTSEEPLNVGVRKRKLEDDDDETVEGAPAARKGWGSTTKSYPGLGSTVDAELEDLLSGRTAPKMESSSEDKAETGIEVKQEAADPSATETTTNGTSDLEAANDNKSVVKKEIESLEAADAKPSPSEVNPSIPEVVFKKRKPKSAKQG